VHIFLLKLYFDNLEMN